MFLNNYYRILALSLMSQSTSTEYSKLTEFIKANEQYVLKPINGGAFILARPLYSDSFMLPCIYNGDLNIISTDTSVSTSITGGSFIVGTGSTPPTLDDYCLESEITNLTKVSTTFNIIDANESLGFSVQITKTYVNQTTEDITIGEIGYFKRGAGYAFSNSKWQTSESKANVLTFREVLDEPLVVPAGQGATVTLNITFNGFEVLSSASATTE